MPLDDGAKASIRPATMEDVPALERLIAASVNGLQAGDYSDSQRQAALGSVFGVDSALIHDGTYFVAVWEQRICACGGWSKRATAFGSDQSPVRDDRQLDPQGDAARIRALKLQAIVGKSAGAIWQSTEDKLQTALANAQTHEERAACAARSFSQHR